jgi:polyisoprenoid-binding protein YceI
MRRSTSLLWMIPLLLVPPPAQAAPQRFRLLAGKSSLVAHLLKAGAGSRFAHDHVVRARELSGQVLVDPDDPARSRIQVTVQARSLVADEPALRKRYGMKQGPDASDREKIEKTLRSAGQLDVARHPTIRFVSTAVTPAGKGRYRVRGKLTLRGVSRPVTLVVKARVAGSTFKGSGRLRIRQSAFGYKPYKAMLGLVKVQDLATLNLYLEGKRE